MLRIQMEKSINHNIMFLKKKAVPVTWKNAREEKETKALIRDLQDTLKANHERCVGMAANMIGVNKAAIIVSVGPFDVVMLNPVIQEKNDAFETEEGYLSLEGLRPTVRYKEITVEYDTTSFEHKTEKFTGWVAQIIQHECDHLKGIII